MIQIEHYNIVKGYVSESISKSGINGFKRTSLKSGSLIKKGLVAAISVISILATITAVATATTIYVPDGGIQTIQQAVDNAVEGDEIVVRDAYTGTKENVDINVSHLTIRSENNSVMVEAADPYDHVFYVKANYTRITGFTATGTDVSDTDYSAGIYLDQVNHCDISNNNVTNNFYGIYLSSSHENTISGNVASSNKNYGIYLLRSSTNTIIGNAAHSNNNPGIYLYASNENIISGNSANSNRNSGISLYSSNGNTFSGNSANINTIYGISLFSSHSNTFSSNAATGNENSGISLFSSNESTFFNNFANSNNNFGIYLSRSNRNTFSSNTANANENSGISLSSSHENNFSDNSADSNNNFGIYLDAAHNNTISGNSVNSNEISGIYLEASPNNVISDNIALRNSQGIYLYYSNSNTISGNNASNNNYGISLYYSNSNTISGNTANSNNNSGILLEASGNIIYNNYFDNPKNAGESGSNTWNVSKTPGANIIGGSCIGGNYWSDYAGIDTDGDGLGDTLVPYNSLGNIEIGGDWLPLVRGTTPPTITNVTAASITTESAIISWDTDKPSDSLVQYGTESGSHLLNASDTTAVTSHSITLNRLSTGTTYYYVVKSTDQNGNSVESNEYSFTTGAAARAVIPAEVVIKPETLNLKSKGIFTAFIALPEGHNVADIDINTVVCEGSPAVAGMVADDNKYIAKFNREDLISVEPGDVVTLVVTGKLNDKTPFEGSATIRVTDKGGKK